MYKRRLRFGELLKRALLIGLVTVAVVAGGAKLLAEYRVESAMLVIATRLAPFGDLRYLDVSTSYDGRVHIDGISFYPGDDLDIDPILAEEAVVLTPGMLYLLGFEGGPIPNRMGLSLLGLWVDIASYTGLGEYGGGALSGNPFESLACGNVDTIQAPDLERMGYSREFRMDLHMRYRMMGDTLQISFEQSSVELSGFSLSLDILAPGILVNPFGIGTRHVKLTRIDLQLDSAEFNRRRNAFCADAEGVSESEYIERNIRQAMAQLRRRGVVPGDEIVEHYRAFIKGAGSWSFESTPVPPIALSDIIAFDIDQLLEWLSIASTVDGKAPETVRFETFDLVSTDEEDEDASPREDMVDQRVVLAQRLDPWITIELSTAPALVDERIRVFTVRAKEYSGTLLSVDGNQIILNTRVPGGLATIPILRSQIDEFQTKESILDRLGLRSDVTAEPDDPSGDQAGDDGESEPVDGDT